MRLGAVLMPGQPAQLAEQARKLEGEGFESIWSAHATGRGFLMTDPFIALATAAAVTQSVELGTAILQLPLYHPTDIAIKAISLQQTSNNRFILGVGAGSTESDFVVHGKPFAERFDLFQQTLSTLRTTLSDGSANGGNIGANDAVPIFYGTWGKNVALAATDYDGWIASGMKRTPEQCVDAINNYRSAGGSRAIVSTIQVTPDTDLGALGATLSGYAEAGFDDAVVMVHNPAVLASVRALV